LIGGVVCSAAAIAGDNLQDLKAGHLIGATAWKLQVMQGIGVVSAVLVMAPILNLLLHAYGFGAPSAMHPQALPAPQATLMAAVASGVFGAGLPWVMVGIGAAAGIVIVFFDEWLKHRKALWRAPVLAVAVGIYLPFELSTPIFLGGLIGYFARRYNDKRYGTAQVENHMRRGMLFAAGLITGEALLGIILAVPIVIAHNTNVFAVPNLARQGAWLGLIAIALVAVALARAAMGAAAADKMS
ncbi:MAG TPA: oligopeptide transporter, OPT family, partial [Nitrococcus sp.]|nr:oligopeptide transporter, OPT family [Nitrococcus sp.]